MRTDLQCRVELAIEDVLEGPWSLPQDEVVTVGRASGTGLRTRYAWVPLRLCRLMPMEHGWLLQNGSRARVLVQNQFVAPTSFSPHALIALQAGVAVASWPDLDDMLRLDLSIGPGVADGLPCLQDGVPSSRSTSGTAYAVHEVTLTAYQRRKLAAMFRHLILGGPKPLNLAKAAAAELGIADSAVLMTAQQVRNKINQWKWQKLEDNEALGHYLVTLTRTLTAADLPEGKE